MTPWIPFGLGIIVGFWIPILTLRIAFWMVAP
jgi:hypothetical protein